MAALDPGSLRPDARTTRLRAALDEPAWELWRRTPHAALREVATELWAGAISAAFARHRTLPNGEVCLMLHVGPAQRAVERDGQEVAQRLAPGFLAGLHERPFTIESVNPDTAVVAARLRPSAVAALFPRTTPGELIGEIADLSDLIGASAAAELCGRASASVDLGAALDVLEHWLLARLRPERMPRPASRHASARIASAGGNLRVAQLAREMGISARRLHELFQRDIGLAPKRVARIARFRSTLDRICRGGAGDLAGLALAAGYYDESHLYREFRELALLTPTEYRVAHGGGLDGPDVIG